MTIGLNVIIGNVIATIAAMFMIYAGVLKEKKKILYVQTIQIILLVMSNFVLGGIVGGIVNILCVVRNILAYNEKLGLKEKVILSVLSVGISLYFNDRGFLGLLPMFSTTLYIWLMNVKDVVKFKWLIVFTNFTWFIYDVLILSIVTVFFDAICISTNIGSIIDIVRKRKKSEKEIKNEQKV